MNDEIFTSWLKQLGEAMFIEVEKTELITGNCSSYLHVGSLETSNLQSISQVVIQAFRVKYRPVIPKFYTTDIEAKQETPTKIEHFRFDQIPCTTT